MTRRFFLLLPATAMAQTSQDDDMPDTPPNRFARAWNAWARACDKAGPYMLSVEQTKTWREVKKKWKELAALVDY